MALITLDDVKNFYGITGDRTEDNDLIENLILRFTSLFENYCSRISFEVQTFTDVLDGSSDYYLFPEQYPITSVSGIYDDSSWVWEEDSALEPTSYRIANKNSIVSLTPFTKGLNNIKVVYSAGFNPVPEDLKQALIEEVVRSFKNRKTLDIIGITASDGSVSRLAKDLLPTTQTILNRYVRKYVV
jgi:hypothetical protein